MKDVFQLRFNDDNNRLELNGEGLHCGDAFEVLYTDSNTPPLWKEARLEYSDNLGWYLLTVENEQTKRMPVCPAGLFARAI